MTGMEFFFRPYLTLFQTKLRKRVVTDKRANYILTTNTLLHINDTHSYSLGNLFTYVSVTLTLPCQIKSLLELCVSN